MAVSLAAAPMEKFVIDGGVPLSGTVVPAGNKNGALPILAASVLTPEEVVVRNVPRIRDVDAMLRVLRGIGVRADWRDVNEVVLCAAGVDPDAMIDRAHAERIRASFLLAGPLLSRFGRATMPPPGGDVIGRRRLDPHIHAFNELGASIDVGEAYDISADRLRGTHVFLDEASVMATENTVMAAVLAEGETVLGNAACEPHVQDLCRFLGSLGAQIEGIESNVLRIYGVDRLGGGSWSLGPDHIEVGSFIGMAAITGGDITIEGTRAK